MTVVFDPDFEEKLRRSRQLRDVLRASADEVADVARAVAPHGTGRYGRSIETFSDPDGIGVLTSDPFGHLVEWGSANNPAYGTLRNAATIVGLDVVEDPRS